MTLDIVSSILTIHLKNMNYKTLQKITTQSYITTIFNNHSFFIIAYNNSKLLKVNTIFSNQVFTYGFFFLEFTNISKRQLRMLGLSSKLLQGNVTLFFCVSYKSDHLKDFITFLTNYCVPFIFIQDKRFVYFNENEKNSKFYNNHSLVNLLASFSTGTPQFMNSYLYSIPFRFNFLSSFVFVLSLILYKKQSNEK